MKRFRKNRNCSLVQESIHLGVVTFTADGRVNNIKFASYLTGNRPLTCKRMSRVDYHLIHELFFMSYTKGVNAGFAKGEALRLPRPIRHAQRLIKKLTEFQICLKRIPRIRLSETYLWSYFLQRDSILENNKNSACILKYYFL